MPHPSKGKGIQRDYLTINRVCKRRYLNFLYAPDGKRGKYYVCSELIGDVAAEPCLKAHIIRKNGKYIREWLK